MYALFIVLALTNSVTSKAMELVSSTNATEMKSVAQTYVYYQQGIREQSIQQLSVQDRRDIVEQASACCSKTWWDIKDEFKYLARDWAKKYNFVLGDKDAADAMLNAAINSTWGNKNRYQTYLQSGGNSKEDFVFNYLHIKIEGKHRQIRDGLVPETIVEGRNDALKYFLRRVGHEDANTIIRHNGFYIGKPDHVTATFKILLEAIVNKEREDGLQSRSYILGIMFWFHACNKIAMVRCINNNELVPGLPIETEQLFKQNSSVTDVSILHKFAKDIAHERDFMVERK